MPLEFESKPCLVKTERGFSVAYRNHFLYSKYNPARNILSIIEKTEVLPGSIILCFSPVLNYGLKELSEKLPEAIVTPLEGTYLCWVDLKAYVSEENIKDMIQKKCRLAVDYGDWFGGERFGTHIRINLATSHENVKIAVDALVDNI